MQEGIAEQGAEAEVAVSSRAIWWNCGGGLLSKIDFIKNYIKTNKPFLLFISEAEIRPENINLAQINGYDLLTASTFSGEFKKSRMTCYVDERISYKQIDIKSKISDIVALEFQGRTYVGVYKGFKLPTNVTRNLSSLIFLRL